uniref:Uncharacterized protein n=1 Tax=Spongospora subterranea TaxID=70186 RepID=A0A0H5QSS2_9EUKA|eukprot:CRZ05068.1 hypothetical protein [Spongospora subterranea]
MIQAYQTFYQNFTGASVLMTDGASAIETAAGDSFSFGQIESFLFDVVKEEHAEMIWRLRKIDTTSMEATPVCDPNCVMAMDLFLMKLFTFTVRDRQFLRILFGLLVIKMLIHIFFGLKPLRLSMTRLIQWVEDYIEHDIVDQKIRIGLLSHGQQK